RDHPYGHAKYESFAAMGIAILLFAGCLQLIVSAAGRLQSGGSPNVTGLSFVVMALTLIINVGVSSYEYILGRRLKSSILVADSLHTRSDVFASLGVILGLFAVRVGYPLADPIIALFICALIIHTGLEIIRESSTALLDRAVIDEQVIVNLARSVEGVCNCHAVRTRGMAEEIYVDLHIEVDASLSMELAHEVGVDVERAIKGRIPEVRDVVVHLEPKDYCDNKEIPI
nr:cation diffusion facilitator family transporter [Methanothrix sp.]